jgi:predicted nucleic acid-binding protein
MRWFFAAGSHPYADSILQGLATGSDTAFVPALWSYEVSAVLARAQLKTAIPTQDVTDFLNDLTVLPITTDDNSVEHIFPDVHRLAVSYRLTSYDASYLELALRRQLPLATLDADLLAACNAAGIPARKAS